jgi:hypothetical protein
MYPHGPSSFPKKIPAKNLGCALLPLLTTSRKPHVWSKLTPDIRKTLAESNGMNAEKWKALNSRQRIGLEEHSANIIHARAELAENMMKTGGIEPHSRKRMNALTLEQVKEYATAWAWKRYQDYRKEPEKPEAVLRILRFIAEEKNKKWQTWQNWARATYLKMRLNPDLSEKEAKTAIDQEHAARVKDAQHTKRGVKVLNGSKQSGEQRAAEYRQKVTDAEKAIAAYRSKNTSVSLTAARERIAPQFGISRKTLERHAAKK